MTCRELLEFLLDYTDGTLPEHVRQAVDRHLAVCPACVAYLQSYRQTCKLSVEAYLAKGQPQLPPMPEGLVRAILSATAKP